VSVCVVVWILQTRPDVRYVHTAGKLFIHRGACRLRLVFFLSLVKRISFMSCSTVIQFIVCMNIVSRDAPIRHWLIISQPMIGA